MRSETCITIVRASRSGEWVTTVEQRASAKQWTDSSDTSELRPDGRIIGRYKTGSCLCADVGDSARAIRLLLSRSFCGCHWLHCSRSQFIDVWMTAFRLKTQQAFLRDRLPLKRGDASHVSHLSAPQDNDQLRSYTNRALFVLRDAM